jgi:hypothetical protein
MKKFSFLICVLMWLSYNGFSQSLNGKYIIAPVVGNPTSATVINSPIYEKIEIGLKMINIPAVPTQDNIYDPDQIDLYGELYDNQNNLVKKVYGFYMKEYLTNTYQTATTYNTASPTYPYNFRIRFTVDKLIGGAYTLKIFLKNNNGAGNLYTTYTINAQANTTGYNKKGFLKFPEGKKYLAFDNGDPFFGVAQNFTPLSTGDYYKLNPNHGVTTPATAPAPCPALQSCPTCTTLICYPDYFVSLSNYVTDKFSQQGGNFARTYMAPESFDIETVFSPVGNYTDNLNRAQDFDKVLAYYEEKGIYLQLAPFHHDFMHIDEPDNISSFDYSPYKLQLNLNSPRDLFINPSHTNSTCASNPVVDKLFYRKIRYVMARWGYSTHLASIETFSEADKVGIYWNLTCDGKNGQHYVDALNIRLANKAKEYVPRILTTMGTASAPSGEIAFSNNAMDYTGYHSYCDLKNFPHYASTMNENFREKYQKPFSVGEYGWGGSWGGSWIFDVKDDYTSLRNFMWSGSLSGSFTSPLHFWDKGYTYHTWPGTQQGYFHYKSLAAFFQGENLNEYDYIPEKNPCVEVQTHPLEVMQEGPFSNCNVANMTTTAMSDNITTSDNSKVDVFCLKSPKRILGWVHNKENYWYNLPHSCDGVIDPTKIQQKYEAMIHPTNSSRPFSYPFPPNDQTASYVPDVVGQTMTISNLVCNGTYQIDWYKTFESGGPITNPNFVSTFTVTNGTATIPLPDLKRYVPNTNSYPDYAFKISLKPGLELQAWNTNEIDNTASLANNIGSIFTVVDENTLTGKQEIFYRGGDNKLHRLYYSNVASSNEKCYTHEIISGSGNDVHMKSAITWVNPSSVWYSNGDNYLTQIDGASQINGVSQWVVTEHTTFPKVRTGSSIVKNSIGQIFYISVNSYVVCVKYDGTSWVANELIGTGLAVGAGTNLAITSDNKIFYRNSAGYLQQIYWTGSLWIGFTHTNQKAIQTSFNEIVIDKSDRIFYRANSTNMINNCIVCVYWSTTLNNWTQTVFEGASYTYASGDVSPIILNYQASSNTYNVFYKSNTNYMVRLSQQNGGNWQSIHLNNVINNTTVKANSPLAVHPDNVVFFLTNAGTLAQLWFNGTSWAIHGHSYSSTGTPISPVSANQKFKMDRWGKLFYAKSSNQRLELLWWKNCSLMNSEYVPCSYNSFRQTSSILQDYSMSTSLYPNPTHGKFTVEVADSEVSTNMQIIIFDYLGKIIYQRNITNELSQGINTFDFDLSKYSNGLYLLNIVKDNVIIDTKKIVKN